MSGLAAVAVSTVIVGTGLYLGGIVVAFARGLGDHWSGRKQGRP